jgi:hypothetical protein
MTIKWLARILEKRDGIEVKKIGASRAKYESPDIQRIEVRMTLEGDLGDLTIILTPSQGHELITNLTTAYTAINPPLRSPGAAGFYGMGN